MGTTLLCMALLVPARGADGIAGRLAASGAYAAPESGTVILPRAATDADLEDLCELPWLKHLGLFDTAITDRGLGTVAGMRWLVVLDLENTTVTDDGLRRLEGLRGLRQLNLHNCPYLTADGVARLQKTLPNCTISR
jgi:hypothetical protein